MAFELIYEDLTQTVALRLGPGEKVTRPQIDARLHALGFDGFFIHEEALKKLLNSNSVEPVVIAERRNAEMRVTVSDDQMSAKLMIVGPYGGRVASVESALLSLRKANVTYGVDEKAVAALVASAEKLPAGTMEEAVVAHGLQAVDGVDAQFEPQVPTAKDRILRPKVREDGSTDYHDLGDIPTVHQGDVLMRRIPATTGELGRNVIGQVLVPKPGKNIAFDKTSGTVISPGNPDLLVSDRSGAPNSTAHGMVVEDLFRVEKVDVSTGHLNFEGSALVKSDVAMNMKVSCQGSVTIGGFVDSALLTAKGDIIIGKGISGGMSAKGGEMRAKAHADGTVLTSFAQFAELHGGVGVVAEKLLMHCHVRSGGWVRMGGLGGGSSKLIGGEVHAVHYVKTDILGAPNDIHTLVHVSGDFSEITHSLKNCSQEIQSKQNVLRELEKVLEKHRNKMAGPAQPALEQRIVATLNTTEADVRALNRLHDELEKRFQEAADRTRVIVTKRAYPGVEIRISDKVLKLNSECGAGSFVFTLTGIQFRSGDIQIPVDAHKPPVVSPG